MKDLVLRTEIYGDGGEIRMTDFKYNPIELGEKIIKKRKECGYSQEEASEKLGISRDSISRYENGASRIPVEVLARMSFLYETSMDYFVKDELIENVDGDIISLIETYTPRQRKIIYNILKQIENAFCISA